MRSPGAFFDGKTAGESCFVDAFVQLKQMRMRGALTTIVPADKKLIHGMRDGILVPTKVVRH